MVDKKFTSLHTPELIDLVQAAGELTVWIIPTLEYEGDTISKFTKAKPIQVGTAGHNKVKFLESAQEVGFYTLTLSRDAAIRVFLQTIQCRIKATIVYHEEEVSKLERYERLIKDPKKEETILRNTSRAFKTKQTVALIEFNLAVMREYEQLAQAALTTPNKYFP